MLENVEVWIPRNVTNVLASEYKTQGYGTGPYEGHFFNFLSRRWESHATNKNVLEVPRKSIKNPPVLSS